MKINKKYFILRIIVFPILFMLIMCKCIYDAILISIRMLWGGFELVKIHHDRITIQNIYDKVSELIDKNQQTNE